MKLPMIINMKRHQCGFTLIEILVSLVVLAIGLLGLAGLQAAGMRNNNSAYHRSQATILAYEIIDRMRVNRTEALTGSYDVALATGPAANQPCEGTSNTCNNAQLATYDLNQWLCSLGKWDTSSACTTMGITGLLPDADGSIVVGGANANAVTVNIQWFDEVNRSTDTVDLKTITVSSQL